MIHIVLLLKKLPHLKVFIIQICLIQFTLYFNKYSKVIATKNHTQNQHWQMDNPTQPLWEQCCVAPGGKSKAQGFAFLIITLALDFLSSVQGNPSLLPKDQNE